MPNTYVANKRRVVLEANEAAVATLVYLKNIIDKHNYTQKYNQQMYCRYETNACEVCRYSNETK